ncbi:hypothetical protein T458_21015 [Brevibacillus panacihumi W25]|uniref:Uncharacterized protein n=2 Tax=Brevibacillus panacihumi TaxID=497735 RepID=V6MEU1_9BACL|nr:hypothetical protein [Brevibacillus panacihumi]EST53913.1 hypothetical protein T458_21015 [Brevibacillus panacihumi W25]RNB78422.1 hypothetical protein EDM58_11505 [Brevibacillus panacihumi]
MEQRYTSWKPPSRKITIVSMSVAFVLFGLPDAMTVFLAAEQRAVLRAQENILRHIKPIVQLPLG